MTQRLERYNLGLTRFDGRDDILVSPHKTKTATVYEMHKHGIVAFWSITAFASFVAVYLLMIARAQ